jgi:hypothetical protein
MFYVLYLRIEFLKEIVFLPLYCMALKDAVFHLKEMGSLRKFNKEYGFFMSKCFNTSYLFRGASLRAIAPGFRASVHPALICNKLA